MFIDIYSFIPASDCECMGPSALLCPVVYNAVKTALCWCTAYNQQLEHWSNYLWPVNNLIKPVSLIDFFIAHVLKIPGQ